MTGKGLPDIVFIKKLHAILEAGYSSEDFGVQELSVRMGLSHTQLHRKIKAESGKSISQYIREFRLEKSRELLVNDIISASEVAYRVGFSSPTYFNHCFNNYFGYPPGQAKYHKEIQPESNKGAHGTPGDFKGKVRSNKRGGIDWKAPGIIIPVIIALLISLYAVFSEIRKKQKMNEGLTPESSIAVLPFKNLSENKDNQYFADGVMDDIINHLSTIQDLRVISRTTMDQYKGTSKTVPEIAKELKVAWIIESTIQKYRDSVRLIVQLIDAKKDRSIWAHDFRREFNNIFDLESDIAKQIAAELKATLSPGEIERIDRIPTGNMEAYILYLKGNYSFNSNDNAKLIEYENLLKQCLELDPDFALAYAALARVKIQRMRAHFIPVTRQEIEEAKGYALKSIELDDNARGHASLGWLFLWFEWNWAEAEKQFRLAIQINPNEANGHVYLAEYLYNIKGDFAEARKHLDLALYLAPYAYYPRSVNACFYYNEGNFIRSLEEAQKMKEIDLENPGSYWRAFLNHIKLEEDDKAFEELLKKWELSHVDPVYIQQLKESYREKGMDGVFKRLLTDENSKISGQPYLAAQYCALAGEMENAVSWLEKAFKLHDPGMPYVKFDPLFMDLHRDERLLNILEKMNLTSY